MTLGRTLCVAVNGIDGTVVEVEAFTSPGQPAFGIIGLPDSACRQAPDRIKAAAANSTLLLPRDKITVNLAGGADQTRIRLRPRDRVGRVGDTKSTGSQRDSRHCAPR